MIDVERECLLTWSEARLQFPQRPSVRTLRHWAQVGHKGVVLESTPLGRERGTSKEACGRFLRNLKAKDES